MERESHELLTKKVIEWLAEFYPGFVLRDHKEDIAANSGETDYLADMEFIDVEGGLFGHGRDNPHKKELNKIDDVARTANPLIACTTFNHFIDIRKGEGIFDDFDGYSYKRGSGCTGQYQEARAATDNMWASFISALLDKKVDDAVNWRFNDEYVHAPGHEWYAGCSPAVERYSFYRDKERKSSFSGVYRFKTLRQSAYPRFARRKLFILFSTSAPLNRLDESLHSPK